MAVHVVEAVRPLLSAPLAERIAFLRAPRWIGTDAALAAHRRLQALLERPPGCAPRACCSSAPTPTARR